MVAPVPSGVRVIWDPTRGQEVVVRPGAGSTRDEPLLDAARWISGQVGISWPARPEACGHYACIWGPPDASWVMKLTFDPNDIRRRANRRFLLDPVEIKGVQNRFPSSRWWPHVAELVFGDPAHARRFERVPRWAWNLGMDDHREQRWANGSYLERASGVRRLRWDRLAALATAGATGGASCP